jgi:hypothetical protein
MELLVPQFVVVIIVISDPHSFCRWRGTGKRIDSHCRSLLGGIRYYLRRGSTAEIPEISRISRRITYLCWRTGICFVLRDDNTERDSG